MEIVISQMTMDLIPFMQFFSSYIQKMYHRRLLPDFTICVTRRMSHKNQELLILSENLGSTRYVCAIILLSVLYFLVLLFLYMFFLLSVTYAQYCMCPYIVHSWLFLRFYQTLFNEQHQMYRFVFNFGVCIPNK